MRERTVGIDLDTLRSGLIPLATVLCVLGALFAIPTAVMLLSESYTDHLLETFLIGGITENQARMTWLNLYRVSTVIAFVFPTGAAAGLCMLLAGKKADAMAFFLHASQVLTAICRVTAVILAVIFAVRIGVKSVTYLRYDTGVYLIFAMVITEAVMAVIVMFALNRLRRFFIALGDYSAAIGYTLTSGRIDTCPLPSAASNGFLALAIVWFLQAADRMMTLTVSYEHVNAQYRIVFSSHIGQYLAAISLVVTAVAFILLAIYLRRYKRICERTVFEERKKVARP